MHQSSIAWLAFLLASLRIPATAQTIWHVDDDASHDPGPGDPTVSDPLEDGSIGHPFDSLREAVDVASTGDEIVVEDGMYVGTGNRRVFLKAGLYVRSAHGPKNCILELEGHGPGFYFTLQADAVLEGFTIQNG